jgi:hypothetical protein
MDQVLGYFTMGKRFHAEARRRGEEEKTHAEKKRRGVEEKKGGSRGVREVRGEKEKK